MATVRKEIQTRACPAEAWAAIRDIGALHTRLVPGFVTDTRLEPGARIVTFGNGMVVREPIITIDEPALRLVWTVEGGRTTHYNASAQVIPEAGRHVARHVDGRFPSRHGGKRDRRDDVTRSSRDENDARSNR